MSHVPSYPSIYALGHRALEQLFADDVLVEEKIDGSQFSFGRTIEGELVARTKGKNLVLDAPEKMFVKAVETIKAIEPKIVAGWYYRCEYLSSPSHNVLAYDRVPKSNIILFDIDDGQERYLPYREKKTIAESLGLEIVPQLFHGRISHVDEVKHLLDTTSILGGQKVEGLIFKNYHRFGIDKRILIGKFVSELFKEVHEGEWRAKNPTQGDIVDQLISKYKSEARQYKAIQHLRDAGELEDSPRDIGKLIKELPEDLLKECEGEIKDLLFAHFWPKIRRGVIAGFPEWYKEQLLKKQFNGAA